MGYFDQDACSMLDVYLLETRQQMGNLEEILLDTEDAEEFSEEDINSIFRIMHTAKSSSAMMGLHELSETAHDLENLFELLRGNHALMKGRKEALYEVLFRATDFIQGELSRMEDEAYEPAPADELKTEILKLLSALRDEKTPEKENDKKEENAETACGKRGVRVFFEPGCKMEHIRSYMLIRQIRETYPDVRSLPRSPEQETGAEEKIRENGFVIFAEDDQINGILEIVRGALFVHGCALEDGPENAQEAPETPKAPGTSEAPKAPGSPEALEIPVESSGRNRPLKGDRRFAGGRRDRTEGEYLNVRMERLDELQNLTEELMILFSSLRNDLKKDQYAELDEKYSHSAVQLLDELSDAVGHIRLVPVTEIAPKLRRVLRDISKKQGKEIEFQVTGQSVEADKNIVEHLYEACLHIVRNAADHGIEPAEDRIKAGKPKRGTIELHLETSGSGMKIQIRDDGIGMDEEELRKKAREKHLLTKPEGEYTREELYELTTLPGFSTSEKATEYSGRGVGMDIVRKITEECGGHLRIESEKGAGTVITMEMPMTRTVIEAVRFDAGGVSFAVPASQVNNFLEYDPESVMMKRAGGRDMVLYKNQMMPVIDMAKAFGLEHEEQAGKFLVCVETGSAGICLLADQVAGEEKMVLKPLPALLGDGFQRRTGINGCSILGDGNICLALDVESLLQAVKSKGIREGRADGG